MDFGLQIDKFRFAEINLANNSEAFRAGKHPGYEKTALDGIRLSLDLINEHRIKVVLNGGALNPKGLALEVQKLVMATFLERVDGIADLKRFKRKDTTSLWPT